MKDSKTVALVAHDHRKPDLVEWVELNYEKLAGYKLVCTGTTGKMVGEALETKGKNAEITLLKSGPLGGDQQLGAMISNGDIDLLIFFWDPMRAQPHDVDVKALLRIATVYNIPTATNRSTADFIISSPLLEQDYKPKVKDYSSYINRKLD